MEIARIQVVLAGGSWRRGTRVPGAVEGNARALVINPQDITVHETIVSPRRARSLGRDASAPEPDASAQGFAVLAAGLRVHAARQPVGRLSRVWCRADTFRVTHFLVRERARWPRPGSERIVPVEYVESITHAGVVLKVAAPDFHHLPLFRPDQAILIEAQAAVDSVLAEPRARRQVKLRVDDGQVTLAGEVDTVDQARLAERAVADVPGVRGLVVDLVAQETLAALVEERIAALGTSVLNGHGPIEVYSEHGIVYLEGSVPTPEARRQVEQAALAAAGAKVVVNNLRVNGQPPERGQGTGPLVRNK